MKTRVLPLICIAATIETRRLDDKHFTRHLRDNRAHCAFIVRFTGLS